MITVSPPVVVLRESPPSVVVAGADALPRIVGIEAQRPPLLLMDAKPAVLVVAKQGDKGPQGIEGPAGAGAEITVVADQVLSGHRIVGYSLTGELVNASNQDLNFFSSVLGLTLNAALVGENVTVAINREVVHAGWSWTMGLPIFLATNGTMTQTPPDAPALFSMQVGFPTSPTSMWVEIDQAIEL